jgi:hypothetical protein
MVDNAKRLVSSHPKLAIAIYGRVGLPQRLKEALGSALIPDILARPKLYYSSTDALCLLFEHLAPLKQLANYRNVRLIRAEVI